MRSEVKYLYSYTDSFYHVELSPFASNWIHPLNEGNGEEGASTNGDEDDLCLLSHTCTSITSNYMYNVHLKYHNWY